MSDALEDEKRALLERMRASRNAYRSRFLHADEDHHVDTHSFPRSHTFKFLIRHPYSATLAALAAVAVLPRGSVRKAVKGSAAIAAGMAGILGSRTKTSMITRILPPVIRLLRSNKPRSR